ncbi:phosphotransferase [Candidatus Enterococcus murrayae]|uniref:Phosphotransferase n=1 Tax=Candidatus Enterococcus murrayae TaxID=2815321 RepID=A0ABS3HMR9_9ENTE|nr:phosphotransferase [Enterococcus sp. MJM16]MBO0454766.1 phosphotransferase [Enterococcus sp. MJM16]
MEISEHTLADYLLQRTTLFNKTSPLIVTALSNEKDKYVDGYLNYLYILKQGNKKYITKHSKTTVSSGIALAPIDPKRNYLEYMTYQLRAGLAPQMVPETYFADPTAHLFVMEDLSYLTVLRFSLCRGQQFPRLGKQVGEYLARTHLATAKMKLSADYWHALKSYFQNGDMRIIITDFILKPPPRNAEPKTAYEEALLDILDAILEEPVIKQEWDTLIERISTKDECLIHGDFHSSNIFVSQNSFKVIDMEYTMTGPFSYDIGYFLANILSQYAAFSIKGDASMCEFLLQVIKDTYKTYFTYFSDHTAGAQKDCFLEILQDSLGYLAMANINRIANLGEFPDFDCLASPEETFLAKGLSMMLAQALFKKRGQLSTTEAACQLIQTTRNNFLQQLIL